MNLKERIEEIIEKYTISCKQLDGTFTVAGIPDATIKILQAFEESLPKEITKEYAEKTAAPTYYVKGWNALLTSIKSTITKKEK